MKNKHYFLSLFLLTSFLFSFYSCIDKKQHTTSLPALNDSILSTKLLNSERTKIKFGSYGIDVLRQNSKLRVSNLYSIHGNKNITRTFAVVQYPDTINKAFLKEHTEILKGGSIGKVFKQNHWNIEKKSFYFGEISPSAAYEKLYALMGDISPCKLAIYTYGFNIKKDTNSYLYATISEVYQPDYLTLNDLRKMNPDANKYLNETAFIKTLNLVKNEMTVNYHKLETVH
ncbi:hypothetical protein Q4Q39_03470 [Flavivirga amylovorans]|uniref:Lipoprotein n=1 Tax=Flavivirga amylovorans TaxID=870486 RepID=A0ABT8WXV5_9FLAO|nr:hypothetical protein [Flavivirga amylovorans]MDO5986457.1 hypothetical protein [Flavivirga amylovorans]